MTRSILAASLVIVVAGVARADVVDPPPSSCPPGSTPSSSHSGPLCFPTAECTASSCASPARCVAVLQCIEERACGGRIPPDSGPCVVEHVVGACDASGGCAVGSCRARNVCSSGSSAGGCSCRVGRAGLSAGVGLALLGVALAIAARRR